MATWNFESMRSFIREFDPAEQKYLRYMPKKKEEQADRRRREKALHRKLDQYRGLKTEERWSLEDIEDAVSTVEKVYGEGNDNFFEVIKGASEKFLDQYVEIEGVGQLFRASYFWFEWMMHLEYNPDRHDYTYYRDHYVHQVRNMYEMFHFLDKLGYEEKCRSIYQNLDNKTGRLLQKSVAEELERMPAWEKEIWDALEASREDMEKAMYGYLFCAASIIASLMHDIGYPIAYVGRTVQKLGKFLPFTYLFVEEAETMATIHSVLQDSLLYRVNGQEKVAKQVSKKDHGALSAVILLYKFYDNGKIAALSPVKRAAIELGALMIYNHTMKYETMGAKNGHYYKNVFRENPMSYLFRLCDDLQEWDRSYFEISGKSNFFICSDCYMPITREYREDGKAQGEKSYTCWCQKRRGINTTTFHYRRLYNVEACLGLKIIKEGSGDGRGERQSIRVIYDKGKMLQLAAYSPNYALKRAEGMWEIKKMLQWQQDFPDTYLSFMVSNNPILLKTEIVAEWFEEQGERASFSVWTLLRDDFNRNRRRIETLWALSGDLTELMEKEVFRQGYQSDRELLVKWLAKKQPKWRRKSGSIACIWKKFSFYYCLAFWGQFLSGLDKKSLTEEDCEDWKEKGGQSKIAVTARTLRSALCRHFGVEDRNTKSLVESYFTQKMLQFSEKQYRDIKSEGERKMYFDSFVLNASDTNTVKGYVQGWAYDAIKEKKEEQDGKYDYYSDYYLYYVISEGLKR